MMLYRSGARSPLRNVCRESASAASPLAALRRSACRRSAWPQPSSAIRAARSKVSLNVRRAEAFQQRVVSGDRARHGRRVHADARDALHAELCR